MVKCKICGIEFINGYKLGGHIIHHYKINRIKKIKEIKECKCQYCNKIFSHGYKLGGHIAHCKFNPSYKTTIEKIRLASLNRKHTEKTKKKLSKNKIKFLQEHPDKVPYLLNHSSKRSYPEIVFENALKESGLIGWIAKYRAGIYEYDFAFPKLKIDIEIDGATHLTEKVKIIDKRRDIWSKEQGWKVIRFTTKEIREDVKICINKLNCIYGAIGSATDF